MTRNEEISALELHIEVNEQNLSATPKKYNTGTLRPPSDPSWPKIPPRRLADDTDDIIEPSYVVTLIESPINNCSITQAVTCQCIKPRINLIHNISTRIAKKLPSYTDPRFKRQISQQNIETTDQSYNVKDDLEQMQELINIHNIQQEIKKPEDNSRTIDTRRYHIENSILPEEQNQAQKVMTEQGDDQAQKNNIRQLHRNVNNACCNDVFVDSKRHRNNINPYTIVDDSVSYSKFNKRERLKKKCDYPRTRGHRRIYSREKRKLVNMSNMLHATCYDKSSPKIMNNQTLRKISNKVKEDDECRRIDENKGKYKMSSISASNVCIFKHKTATTDPSHRKAKSFFRKKSRLMITNSDYTLILPGPRCIKGKNFYGKTFSRLKVNQLLHRRNRVNNNMNSIRVKPNALKQNWVSSCSLTKNRQVENSFEKHSSIPLETQKLLNKSYWEYYRKLKTHKIALTNPHKEIKGDKHFDEPNLSLPESQTLQQCSVLSYMINSKLDTMFQASADAEARNKSSDSAANVISNAYKNVYEAGEHSTMFLKRIKENKRATNKRRLILKPIALFGIVMYLAIIFLPMIYDYLFNEKEYDDYDNMSYFQLLFEYIISSFEEAFYGIVDVLNTVFLCPVRFNRKL